MTRPSDRVRRRIVLRVIKWALPGLRNVRAGGTDRAPAASSGPSALSSRRPGMAPGSNESGAVVAASFPACRSPADRKVGGHTFRGGTVFTLPRSGREGKLAQTTPAPAQVGPASAFYEDGVAPQGHSEEGERGAAAPCWGSGNKGVT